MKKDNTNVEKNDDIKNKNDSYAKNKKDNVSTNSNTKGRVLLHVCCACCLTHSVKTLQADGYEVVALFYNPQIYPDIEYDKRVEATVKLCKDLDVELIVDEDDIDIFEKEVKKHCFEKEPENGKRCSEVCYRIRLDETARMCKEIGADFFTTTLTISPHKDANLINDIGKRAGKDIGVNYLDSNFKKKNGFLESIRMSKEHDLYRQNYCGCRYSIRKDDAEIK